MVGCDRDRPGAGRASAWSTAATRRRSADGRAGFDPASRGSWRIPRLPAALDRRHDADRERERPDLAVPRDRTLLAAHLRHGRPRPRHPSQHGSGDQVLLPRRDEFRDLPLRLLVDVRRDPGPCRSPACSEVFATQAASRTASRLFGVLGMVLAIIGLCFKITAVPMHFYAPDVYQGAPDPGHRASSPSCRRSPGFGAIIMLCMRRSAGAAIT